MKSLISYCGRIAELEEAFKLRVDLVVKSAVKDQYFLNEISACEVTLCEDR